MTETEILDEIADLSDEDRQYVLKELCDQYRNEIWLRLGR